MRAIVFVGHGDLPEAMKHSVQMVVGENPDLYAVSLRPEDGKDEFAAKLKQLDKAIMSYDKVLIISDLLGGSPGNAAVELYLENDKVEFISGMNLPMALTALMGEDSRQAIISEGRDGIQDVKACLRGKGTILAAKGKGATRPAVKNGKPFQLKNVRVDARGIHGQVATAWIPGLDVNRIIVIDDLAIKDEMQKTALKMAKPANVKLSVLSCEKAIERLRDPMSYPDENVMVILTRIDTLRRLQDLEYQFKEVNMGNVPNRPGTKAYRKTVNLTEEETRIIRASIGAGTHFTAQMVPTDPQVDFDKIIKEIGRD